MIKNISFILVIFAVVSSLIVIGTSEDAHAAIYVKIPGIPGDVTTKGYEGYFEADSFSFGIEREMKESGEKAGTEDINIGVGELQECTISKSLDLTSANLAQFAINGNSLGTAEIEFVEVGGSGEAFTYLKYKLDRAFVKSWSTSGDADDRPTEEVAFVYGGIEKFSENSNPSDAVKSSEEMTQKTTESVKEDSEDSSILQTNTRVPKWVQSTAKFWIDGNVSDREFINSLGFLVKEKIIDVEVPQQEKNLEESMDEPRIPDWIAQSTKWWINGQVSEDQFLEGIKWMIKNQIISGIQ